MKIKIEELQNTLKQNEDKVNYLDSNVYNQFRSSTPLFSILVQFMYLKPLSTIYVLSLLVQLMYLASLYILCTYSILVQFMYLAS